MPSTRKGTTRQGEPIGVEEVGMAKTRDLAAERKLLWQGAKGNR